MPEERAEVSIREGSKEGISLKKRGRDRGQDTAKSVQDQVKQYYAERYWKQSETLTWNGPVAFI